MHKLAEFLTSDSLTAQGFFEFEGFTGHLPGKRARDFQGWVQISVGCNMAARSASSPPRAAARSPGRSRSSSTRSRALAADGVREVTLLGQNVNSYGRGCARSRAGSPSCCARSTRSTGIERIRYTSPHPADMREDVVRAHAELPALCQHIHLPLQSGSLARAQARCAAPTTASATSTASR